jgi:hypothetical protein
MLKRHFSLVSTLVFMGLFTQGAEAAVACSGQVKTVGLSLGTGVLHADFGYGVANLCGVDHDAGGMSAKTCEILHAKLITAQSLNKDVTFYFFDSLGTCSNLVPWQWPNPAPYYFEIRS